MFSSVSATVAGGGGGKIGCDSSNFVEAGYLACY